MIKSRRGKAQASQSCQIRHCTQSYIITDTVIQYSKCNLRIVSLFVVAIYTPAMTYIFDECLTFTIKDIPIRVFLSMCKKKYF